MPVRGEMQVGWSQTFAKKGGYNDQPSWRELPMRSVSDSCSLQSRRAFTNPHSQFRFHILVITIHIDCAYFMYISSSYLLRIHAFDSLYPSTTA